MKTIATLKAAYPMYYRGLTSEEFEGVVRLWMVQFRENDYKDVIIAVHSLISSRTDTFPPVIGEVKDALRSVTHPDEIPSGNAWDLVMKCIRRGTVHAQEDWEKLPEAVREAISPDEIRRYAESEDFNEGVMMSQFMKRWSILRERKRAKDTMPESLLRQIELRKAAYSQIAAAEPAKIETTAEPAAVLPTENDDPLNGMSMMEYLKNRRTADGVEEGQ